MSAVFVVSCQRTEGREVDAMSCGVDLRADLSNGPWLTRMKLRFLPELETCLLSTTLPCCIGSGVNMAEDWDAECAAVEATNSEAPNVETPTVEPRTSINSCVVREQLRDGDAVNRLNVNSS